MTLNNSEVVFRVFQELSNAFYQKKYIEQVSSSDKEFHFQNWVGNRLDEFSQKNDIHNELSGRNIYPDFTLVENTLGFEVKGLAYPGRSKNYDANSNAPVGEYNGRSIYYVFGRYPKDLKEYPKNSRGNKEYPVVDLVMLHGSFLNSNNKYEHKNKHVDGFGSYGDIMIRDRKMYVVPTPYHLVKGTAFTATLILPDDIKPSSNDFVKVGTLERTEVDNFVTGYSFDLTTNELKPKLTPNPNAGKIHTFAAYRVKDSIDINKRVEMNH